MSFSTVGLFAGILLAIAAAAGGFSGLLFALVLGAVGFAIGGQLEGKFDLGDIVRGRRQ